MKSWPHARNQNSKTSFQSVFILASSSTNIVFLDSLVNNSTTNTNKCFTDFNFPALIFVNTRSLKIYYFAV